MFQENKDKNYKFIKLIYYYLEKKNNIESTCISNLKFNLQKILEEGKTLNIYRCVFDKSYARIEILIQPLRFQTGNKIFSYRKEEATGDISNKKSHRKRKNGKVKNLKILYRRSMNYTIKNLIHEGYPNNKVEENLILNNTIMF